MFLRKRSALSYRAANTAGAGDHNGIHSTLKHSLYTDVSPLCLFVFGSSFSLCKHKAVNRAKYSYLSKKEKKFFPLQVVETKHGASFSLTFMKCLLLMCRRCNNM